MSSSNRRNAFLETAVVFALIMLYIWRMRRLYPYFWILIPILMLASHAFRRETPGKLGFWPKHFRSSLARLGPFVLGLALLLLGLGWAFGTIRPVSVKFGFSSLTLYCGWGFIQQYALNGYFLNRFLEAAPARAPLLAAVFFSAVHAPNWFLMLVTLTGGYVCAKAYLRDRNLYVLGVAHGIIGFLLYLVVPDTISHHLYVGPKWFS
jgi:Type II CAAX prenyl endopeptidase Rce1-like